MRLEDYLAERGPQLVRLATVLTRDPELARDLSQSVLLKVFRGWRRIGEVDHLDAYVRRMLVNEHLSWIRKHSSTEVPTDLSARDEASERDEAAAVDDRDRVRRLLDQLPPRARTALVLRYYADLDDAAIAAAMGVSPSSVRSSISRSLDRLRGHEAVDDSSEDDPSGRSRR